MADSRSVDVAIVGSGIAGSALALALQGSDLDVALIEAQTLEPPALPDECDLDHFDARVSALTPRSQAFLEKMGAWQSIADYRLCSYRHMTVWDADGTGQIEFDHREVNTEELGHIVENRAIISALLQPVHAAGDVALYSPASVQAVARLASSELALRLDSGVELRAALVVAADGANSAVRRLLDFETREWDYGHSALAATVRVSNSHEHTAWQRFLPSGPLAFLPLPSAADKGGSGVDAHFCSIVWSLQEALVDDMLALDDAEFCAQLERAFESRLGTILGSSRRFAFPLRQRHAIDYVQPGVALVADAAHTIHPLAGQGINLGLQDVAVLAEELRAGIARGASPGQIELLRRYQRRRKGENLGMMTAMDGFKRLFEHDALSVRWLRNVGLRGVNRLGPLKQQLMRHAMGLA